MFPDGWPGAGLLLLRAAAGGVLIAQGATYLSEKRELGFLMVVVASAVIAIGVVLLIGLLTRFVAVGAAMVGVSSIFSCIPGFNVGSLQIHMTAGLLSAIAVSLICLGPGAMSVDAMLFGRREIIIPPNHRERDSI